MEEMAGSLVFAVNGERFELFGVDPSTTLLEFLRSRTRFKSVKLSCGEGGCGACVVLLAKYDPVLQQVEEFTVNSCLTLLRSINGCSITTTEGLGNTKSGFHPIHQRFAGFHASQCGFCTPGMCVSLFSALINAEKTNRPEPPPGFSKLTVSEAEKAIQGNLCRCTGYRPIADACKSFAADVDIEDLGLNSFWNKDDNREVKASRLPFYDKNIQICTYPEFLKHECKSIMPLDAKEYSWYTPVSLDEIQRFLEHDLAESGKQIKLIVGNTGAGYYKELERYDKYIDLRYIPELSMIRLDQTGIEIGAAVTISKAIFALRKKNKVESCSEAELVFQKIADHMEKIASKSVRNLGSVGGNLVMAQQKGFASDIASLLLVTSSSVTIMTGVKREIISFEEFLARPPLDSKSVLISVRIPCLEPLPSSHLSGITNKVLFETYRAAPRPLGNALPYLNAAFLADISPSKSGAVINNIQLAFGAYGTKHAVRARKVEKYLTGKLLTVDVLYEAVKLVRATIIPQDGTTYPAFRSSLAVGFLFEFLYPLVDTTAVVSDGWLNGCTNAMSENNSKTEANLIDQHRKPALLSSAKQTVESSRDYYPVGEPIIKSGAAIQASGEAVFVDDIPSPTNCLHGAFIYSTQPFARVNDVKFKPREVPDGLTAVISFRDIPIEGENIGAKTGGGIETLFADNLTRCAGERLAFVVADTQKLADMAASMAVVDYDTENLEPPILTVEEAVERSSFFEVSPAAYPNQVGDFSRGMAEADHKILSAEIKFESQYYFYMETQTALAIPDEDNCMVVYSSTQNPEFVQNVVARCLGVPEHNVRVITRRVGGGFGGKAIRAIPVATACALAAQKLGRPVRTYLNRKTDMMITGGRHPMKITYSVWFKSSGKITALHLDILINAGISADISPSMPGNIVGALKKYFWGALSFDIKVCKTNISSKSAMRAPGEVQGSYIAEAVIENVASWLCVDVDSVRNINLHTFESLRLYYKDCAGEPPEYTLPSIWDKLARSSNFFQRMKMLNHFNLYSRWQKRGISRIPIFYEVALRATPGKVSIFRDGSIVVEVGGIELGQGLWTKVKQTTAFSLSSVPCDGTQNLLEKVRVIQSDTLSLVQGGITAGSSMSESCCEAVRRCCNTLVERLTTLKKKLMDQTASITWNALTLQAHSQSVNLSASTYYVPESTSMRYLNYGAAVSEVEVNILTGETQILRSDIIYDCGKSLNPAVDLGQIEGSFIQGVGFFMQEEHPTNSEGLALHDGTWNYKIPTIDTIPKEFNVEIMNSGNHKNCILSSKASGEPPLLLAASVHCATRAAIKEARKELISGERSDGSDAAFQLDVPATMPIVKTMCGLDSVEKYLQGLLSR